MKEVLQKIKGWVPVPVKRLLLFLTFPDLRVKLMILTAGYRHRRALSQLSGKPVLRCVFFALFEDVWKYDRLYQLMERHPRFEPVILVCPVVNFGYENMLSRMHQAYEFYQKKGYQVVCSYDETTGQYVDVRKELHPDIIFYTNPYEGLIDERYYIKNFQDKLTVYVPYYMTDIRDYALVYDQLLHCLVWRMYLENSISLQCAQAYSRRQGHNMVVSGYPGIEAFIDHTYQAKDDCWKIKNHTHKRIIWAPHHTICPVAGIHYSCFLFYADFMLEMAKKYKDEVEFAFKPHPILKNRLYEVWGKEKTDAYYAQWAEMDNTILQEGEYVDLFLTSDAMIHDSGSFIIEYMYVDKPVMFTLREDKPHNEFSDVAKACFENYYFSETRDDIEQFIKNLIQGVDPLKEKRKSFVHDTLIPQGMPSENILNDILDSVDHQVLYRH